MNRSIKFIYFDVGGVLVLDFSKTNKWEQMVDDLEIPNSKRKAFEDLFLKHELDICEGESLDIFVEAAKSQLDIKFPTNYDMLKDFVNRFESKINLKKIFTKKLTNKYPIGLLTNMYPGMLKEIKKNNLLPKIDWNVIVDSSLENCKKPDSKIYEIAEQMADGLPSQILFVENSIDNVEVAKSRAWQTLLYDPSNIDKSNKELINILKITN